MNLEQLIASFRVDADDLEEPHLFKDEWIAAWLSEAQAEAAIRGRLILEDANPAVCQIAVTAGQASYELHRSIYEIADLRLVPAGQPKSVPLALVTREWLDDKRQAGETALERLSLPSRPTAAFALSVFQMPMACCTLRPTACRSRRWPTKPTSLN